jgi:hypothetical protein
MKIALLFCVSITLFFIAACDGKRSSKVSQKEDDTSATIKQECYIATFEKDTAYLNIKTSKKTKVEGTLLIQYGNNPKNDGTIKGQFNGDTLFAEYTYTIGSYKERINKNPLAFLVKGDSLILGIGEIETYVGRSYFKPGAPINFDKGRFRFVKTECKN